MNFFAYQEQARRRTGQLILYYALAVALIVGVIYLILGFAFGRFLDEETGQVRLLWLPDLFTGTAVGVIAVIGVGTLYQIFALASGGAAVARMLGGRLLSPGTRDPLEQRFLNVVEEMALASGVPMPKAYVMDQEKGINAFAAGYRPTDAVVAVTRGCLETLNRDELQGVVAHEFSHILNGDMRLNIRLIGVLYGILLVSTIGYYMFRMGGLSDRRRSSRDRNGGGAAAAIMLAGLGIWIIGYVGVFFANLIKAAVSREREYLADASAVQFTRNPDGLGGALKKIGALAAGSRIASPRAGEASHLFFASGVSSAWLSLTATHPPLLERIRRIDPQFDGQFDRIRLDPGAAASAARARPAPAAAAGFAGAAAMAEGTVQLDSLSGQVGSAEGDYLEFVRAFMDGLPDPLRQALREREGARATAFMLLLSRDPRVRRQQLDLVRNRCGKPTEGRVESMAGLLEQVPRRGWLPLGDLALGTLRQMPPDDYEAFRSTVMALAAADEKIDLFEYAFLRMMVRRLDASFGRGRKPGPLVARLTDVRRECGVLLGCLAMTGEPDPKAATQAFNEAWKSLFPDIPPDMPRPDVASLKHVDDLLPRLDDLRPRLKEALLEACGRCAAHDGRVTVEEADFLRAIADSLECPVPPLSLKA